MKLTKTFREFLKNKIMTNLGKINKEQEKIKNKILEHIKLTRESTLLLYEIQFNKEQRNFFDKNSHKYFIRNRSKVDIMDNLPRKKIKSLIQFDSNDDLSNLDGYWIELNSPYGDYSSSYFNIYFNKCEKDFVNKFNDLSDSQIQNVKDIYEKVSKNFIKIENMVNLHEKVVEETEEKILSILNQATTWNKLVDIWPEVEKYHKPEQDGNGERSLMIIPNTTELNELLTSLS